MSGLGPLRCFIGVAISSTSDGFFISHEKYIQDLPTHVVLTDKRTVETVRIMSISDALISMRRNPREKPF